MVVLEWVALVLTISIRQRVLVTLISVVLVVSDKNGNVDDNRNDKTLVEVS